MNHIVPARIRYPSQICSTNLIIGIERVKASVTIVTFYLLNLASQEPGVVAVHVFSDTRQFLGKTTFTYEDMRKNVVSQAVDQGGDGLSDLLSLIAKHVRSQSSSMKQNSGES